MLLRWLWLVIGRQRGPFAEEELLHVTRHQLLRAQRLTATDLEGTPEHAGERPLALTVEALATGRREHVYHAAMLDPHTAAELDLEAIWAMVDDLLDAHGDMIPEALRHH